MRDRLKLPREFDADRLERDVRNAEASEWVDHFVPAHYEGTWSVLPLRAPAGARHPIQMIYSNPSCEEFVDTPLLTRCPNVQQVLAALPCPLHAVRLMKLAAGSIIKLHRDHDLDAESGHVRLHIPIVTNPDVDFRLNGTRVVMREGECWYLRLSDPHEVANRGATDRVHLVIDALMNPWLAEQLALAESLADPQPVAPAEVVESSSISAPGEGWVPFKVCTDQAEPVVDWCYLGATTFSEPFFEQTIAEVRSRPNQPAPRHTSIATLLEWQTTRPGVPPTAFVFHTSRCGSTLFSRLAAALPHSLVVSEAGVIDQVLRAPVPERLRIEWLRTLINALGQPRRGGERRLFVKFDAWHVAQLALVQTAFPGVPCVFLYREPAAVLASQLRMPGVFVVPGAPEVGMLNIGSREEFRLGREEHAGRVLGAIYAHALPHASAGRVTLINYADLPQAAGAQLLAWCGLDDDLETQDALRHVARFDAKEPTMLFDPSTAAQPSQCAKDAAARFIEPAYSQLESLRKREVGARPSDT